MNSEPAPILISVYNRFEQLKLCIESLTKNSIASRTDLFIVSDAPSIIKHKKEIDLIRKYVKGIKGFQSINLIERENNLGSFLSIKSAIEEVFSLYDKLIFLEDDNIVAPCFLEYINNGLDYYQCDDSVFSISGYNYPISFFAEYNNLIYYWPGFSAWGVGIWKKKWTTVSWEANKIIKPFFQFRKIKKIFQIAPHIILQSLIDIKENKMTIDTIVSVHIILYDKGSIFPYKTKVKNLGHDGKGEHSGISDIYKSQILDDCSFKQDFKTIGINEQINKVLYDHFTISNKRKIRAVILWLFLLVRQPFTYFRQI